MGEGEVSRKDKFNCVLAIGYSVEYVKTLQEHMVRWFKGRGDTHFLQVRFLELKLFLTHDVLG